MDNQQPGSEELQENPSREEIIKWYDDQIEIAGRRHKLTVLQSETVQAEAMRLEALAVIARFRQPEQAPEEENDGDGAQSKPEDKE